MNKLVAAVLVTALVLSACTDDKKVTAPPTSTADAGDQNFSTDDYRGPELPLLAERDTKSGYHLRIREFSWQNMSVPGVSASGWKAPGWCFPTSQYRLSVTSDVVVGVLIGPEYSELNDGLAASAFSLGYADGAPTRVLVLQVGPGVNKASVVWGDGAKDSAEPTSGWVLLAAAGDPGVDFQLTLEGKDGSRTVKAADLPSGSSPAWQKACTETVAVLPPSGQQPSDPTAAESEIRRRFDRLWNAEVSFGAKGADLLDDITGVAATFALVRSDSYADTTAGAVHSMTQLVFTSPTEAWFTYDILGPATNFVNRFGVAHLVGRVWKFSRAVICQDLALSGARCVPESPAVVPPPGGART